MLISRSGFQVTSVCAPETAHTIASILEGQGIGYRRFEGVWGSGGTESPTVEFRVAVTREQHVPLVKALLELRNAGTQFLFYESPASYH